MADTSTIDPSVLDEIEAGRHPKPLDMLPEPDEDGDHPNYVTSTILFERMRLPEFKLAEDIRSADELGGIIDFRSIVPPPEGVSGRALRKWGEANWGIDHNASFLRRVTRCGFEGISFTTAEIPEPVLNALAAKYPDARWSYYAAAWHHTHYAVGEAKDGKFTLRRIGPAKLGERPIKMSDETDMISVMCFGPNG
jgi:hypothetical protein